METRSNQVLVGTVVLALLAGLLLFTVWIAGVNTERRRCFDIYFSQGVGGLNRGVVLGNGVVFGSVNANRRHYQAAADALHLADPAWLGDLITRRVPLADFQGGFIRHDDDVKVVLDLQPSRR